MKRQRGVVTVFMSVLLAIGAGVFLFDSDPLLKVGYCIVFAVAIVVFSLIFIVSTED